MLLALDIGNTQTVIGLYSDAKSEEPSHTWRIATNRNAAADNVRIELLSLFSYEDVRVEDIDAAAIASVVPALSLAWAEAIGKTLSIETLFCTVELAMSVGVFTTDYPNPREIGADRVADAIAARFVYEPPVVVVDFGTATNIEVIRGDGAFVGGIIAPGVHTSADALFSKATRLAAIDLATPPTFIGRSTEHAIQSGIVFGEAGRVDGLLEGIFRELGQKAHVVATGGLAPTIAPYLHHEATIDPSLTLAGLNLFAQAVKAMKP